MTTNRFPSAAALGGLLGLLLLLYAGIFAHRDVIGVDIMEARNLITAREMIETGRWLVPTLHGEPRLAKPPLPTWLTAGAMLLPASWVFGLLYEGVSAGVAFGFGAACAMGAAALMAWWVPHRRAVGATGGTEITRASGATERT